MKRCPTCNKTFTDRNLSFCIDDGTPLVAVPDPTETAADEATIVRPSPKADESGSKASSTSADPVPPYQPPGAYIPPGSPGQQIKRRTWPWIVGSVAIVLVVVGLGIAAVLLIRNIGNKYGDVQRRNESAASPTEHNANAGSDSTINNKDLNDNSIVDDTTPPPTDSVTVLADLKNLEDEWTVANINADKKRLNRILADDYVGTTEGRAQGKAEYLKTVERDTVIQHWEFEDLKVSLNEDRVSLTGTLRLQAKDQQGQDHELLYRFTDKFVWRDGRWQAIASEVSPMK